MAFNPDQPRDDSGRWGEGGGNRMNAKEMREVRANHERSKSSVDRRISRLARKERRVRMSSALREHMREISTASGDFQAHAAERQRQRNAAAIRRGIKRGSEYSD